MSVYRVTDAACLTMEHVFEVDKYTIKLIGRDNEPFTVANLSKSVRAEIQGLIALGDKKSPSPSLLSDVLFNFLQF